MFNRKHRREFLIHVMYRIFKLHPMVLNLAKNDYQIVEVNIFILQLINAFYITDIATYGSAWIYRDRL